jgi:hypothetical protein
VTARWRLRVGLLAQVGEEAQPEAGLARLSSRSIRAGCSAAPAEQLLGGEGGRVVGVRDLYYRKARPGHVRIKDWSHARHDAPPWLAVLSVEQCPPTGYVLAGVDVI